jgi:poly-gamma-glutamate synthesis protein (capsule biosynthesis protein)
MSIKIHKLALNFELCNKKYYAIIDAMKRVPQKQKKKIAVRKRVTMLLVVGAIFAATVLGTVFGYSYLLEPEPEPEPAPEPELEMRLEVEVTPEPEPEPEPEVRLEVENLPEPEPDPEPEFFTIAMMGDTTLASEFATRGRAQSFHNVVQGDFAYPFSLVRHLYEDADFVIVNLESAMSEHDVPADRLFRFNARPEYVNILIEGGVHGVTLGNNHARDFGTIGYEATKENLREHGIFYAPYNGWNIFHAERGLAIGVYSHNFPRPADIPQIENAIREMKAAGAELIIVAPHWGVEGSYRPNQNQIAVGRAAINAGAHIVMGHHPHTIQPMELYNGGVIHFSLANFVFGGNLAPRDQDSYIGKVVVKRDIDGTISIYDTINIPVFVSSVRTHNDFRPMPIEEGTEAYYRVRSKLDGTFTGPTLVVDYSHLRPADDDD